MSEEELRRKYREHEEKLREQARSFNIADFSSQNIKEAYIEELNINVKFGELTAKELIEVQKQPPEKQMYHIVYMMLKKAYPDITIEQVENMDAVAFTFIMNALFKQTNFFKLQEASLR
ncbi:MAG: hypothetical protein QW761_00225 [Candidatus Aenigmatarchaeota archaeon]